MEWLQRRRVQAPLPADQELLTYMASLAANEDLEQAMQLDYAGPMK